MLSVEKFTSRLIRPNHPDWLHVGVDSKDESQLYIIVNGGMANINCSPIELYAPEIKNCALKMIKQGELYLKEHEKSLRIGQGKSLYSYTVKLDEDVVKAETSTRRIYFSSLFIRWQRTHQLSDKHAQEKLGLTAKEFELFREDELVMTQALINKLAEVTGVSEQFWKNRWHQKINNRSSDENV
ncbi:MAG: hypothetical protein ACI9LM_001624 [Alteromonadaceae bacterium]|jgi:hypothetical protein